MFASKICSNLNKNVTKGIKSIRERKSLQIEQKVFLMAQKNVRRQK